MRLGDLSNFHFIKAFKSLVPWISELRDITQLVIR